VEQALLDQATAQKEYNKAVKEFGVNSDEAKQAKLDMAQAEQDLFQAQEDSKQSLEDLTQANLDASQAELDRVGAQNDLAESQRELANQNSTLSKMSDAAGMLSGILGGLVGIIGAITAVQWAWNIAMTANPVGVIIMAIAALIAIIVLIATKTTWFQDLWNSIWGAIGEPVKAAWDWIYKTSAEIGIFLFGIFTKVKDAIIFAFKFAIDFVVGYFKWLFSIPGKVVDVFKSIGEAIYAPFKWAFNAISRAWNNTAGKLSFSIPDWVPGIGGSGFSMPRLPTLQRGGEILRTGAVLAHKGERIMPAGTHGLWAGGSGEKVVVEISLVGGTEEFRRWIKKNTRVYGGGGPNSVQLAWEG
jgi:hypothetical protein